MYEALTAIELIARHRIAERVRYSLRAPKRRLTTAHGAALRTSVRTSSPPRGASSP